MTPETEIRRRRCTIQYGFNEQERLVVTADKNMSKV